MRGKLKVPKLPGYIKKPAKKSLNWLSKGSGPQRLTIFVIAFALIGSVALLATHAASPNASIEPETGSITGNASACIDPLASNGGCVRFAGTGGLPAVPSGEQMCTNGQLAQSPWPATNVPTNLLSGSTLTSFTSGQYGLPTFNGAGKDFPNATTGMIVPTGGVSTISLRSANTVFWYAPGTHNMGQVNPGNNSAFVGAKSTDGTLAGMSTWNGAGNEFGIFNTGATGVTVEYLNMTGWDQSQRIAIVNDRARDEQTWHIAYNYIHDFGISLSGQPQGKGVHGTGHIDHNCFKHIGDVGIGAYGDGTHIEYNEFDNNGWASDTACGCNAAIKGWEAANHEVNNNYIHNHGSNAYGIWYDTSNIGYNIHDNYLAWNLRRAIEIEISQNGHVTNNVLAYNGFVNSAGIQNGGQAAINFNATGAVKAPGTFSDDQILVSGNILWNNWEGLSIYAQDDRNCKTPQPFNNYCTLTDKFSFSHASAGDNSLGGEGGGKLQASCASCSTMTINYQYALGDKIGFASGNYPYKVTAMTPAGGQPAHTSMATPNHSGNWNVTATPAVSGTMASGTNVFGQGTCEQFFSTNPSTAASPTPASLGNGTQTISYFDGCQWLPRNYLIQNNTFHFDPAEIVNSTPSWPITFTGWPAVFEGVTYDARKCTSSNYRDLTKANPTGNNNYCGMNAMFGRPAAYSNNAIMSNSSFTGALANLNSGANPEGPYNNRWIGNTYDGPIGFRAYQETNSAAPPSYGCAGVSGLPGGFSAICVVDAAGWASVWQQH